MNQKDSDEDIEWEVESILKKRIHNNRVEYLLKWKNWTGAPTWEAAENCQCINLIAAFENPKLKRLWNFKASNEKLWLPRIKMLKYMKNFIKITETQANLLRFEPEFPPREKQLTLRNGLNIGPLIYENHWYLVIILLNHICVTKLIMVGDPLNLLVGTQTQQHPVRKRLQEVYKQFPFRPIAMTQMDRSDVCAYYTLAAFERALFLFNGMANFVVDSIFFDPCRAELIRSHLKPGTNGEVSVALPIAEAFDHGPKCEFCKELLDTRDMVDSHICDEHIGYKHINLMSQKRKKMKLNKASKSNA